MRPRAGNPAPKRGRGRPSIDPDGDTVQLPSIAIARAHFIELMRLIKAGKGKTLSDVVRYLIEESAAR